MATLNYVPPYVAVPPSDGGDEAPRPLPPGTERIGMLLLLAAISMMFIGLTSAYIVSKAFGPVWDQLQIYPLVWVNTAVLLFSSCSMELARRRDSLPWLLATLAAGVIFLAGQIAVFGLLARHGFYLNSGRQASFYYVLTALHGIHLLGGIAALAWAIFRRKTAKLGVIALYWHFMDALWLYLLLVIFL